AEQPQDDRVGRPPLVDGLRVEEADQDVEPSPLAGQTARGRQDVAERFRLDLAGVPRRLGGWGDEPADLARLGAGVGGLAAVAEVLPDGPSRRGVGAVVAALPAGVLVEALDALLAGGPPGEADEGDRPAETDRAR